MVGSTEGLPTNDGSVEDYAAFGKSIAEQIRTFEQPRIDGIAIYPMTGPTGYANYITNTGKEATLSIEAATRKVRSITTMFDEIIEAEGRNADLFIYNIMSMVIMDPSTLTTEYGYMVRYAVVTEETRTKMNLMKYIGDRF